MGDSIYRNFLRVQNALTRHDVETYLKVVESFIETAKARYKVGTTIVFLPYNADYLKPTGYTEADIVAAFKTMGVDVLNDGVPENIGINDLIIPGDGHPTGLANRLRAKSLLDLIKKDEPDVLESMQARASDP